MVNFSTITILLLALTARAHGRLKLHRNNVAVNIGFKLPGAGGVGTGLIGALAKLPFSLEYVPDGPQQIPPTLLFQHHNGVGPAGLEHGQQDYGGKAEVHHHHHYHGPPGPESAIGSSIGSEFGGFGSEVGYNEVYRR